MNRETAPPTENPFSSRYVRPGALPFLFPPGESVETIVARFENAGRRGAIVGPHGSGKSTLVETLLPRLRDANREVRMYVLRDGERALRASFDTGLAAVDVLIIDGYEQLGLWGRLSLGRAVRRTGCGLLVTSHRSVRGATTLFAARSTAATTAALVEQLSATTGGFVEPQVVVQLFNAHDGDVREVLFALYDLYELRRS